jgi:thiol-disulfide isomerase/thioredoxin
MTSKVILALTGLMLATVAFGSEIIEPPGADLPREGTGERRAVLDAMELKPFDASLWKQLSDWTNGDAIDADAMQGKVIVIYTWTSYLPTSLRPISTLTRLEKQYGKDGLVVVGVHPDTAWSDAATQLKRRRGSFRIARDTTGAFRKGLHVDQDPDFYLIDRAGQVRFADLDTSALTRAVELLVGETTEQARTLNDRLDAERRDADEAFGRTRNIRQEVQLSDIPELPFPEPPAELYAAIKWTRIVTEDEARTSRNRPPPAPGSRPAFEAGAFYPSQPNFKGRITVAYFFNPKVYQSFQTYQEEANRLQKALGRDAVVLGVMTPKVDPNNRSNRNREPIDPVKWASDFETFAKTRDPKHTLVSDLGGTFVAALTANQRGNRDNGVFAAGNSPYVAIVSSDGVIRWHGPVSSRWFKFMLDEVLRLDPGVSARRAVEEMYRRTNRGG